MIHESGGRFLRWRDVGGWYQVEDVVARNKVAHNFRHLRAKLEKEARKQGDSMKNARPAPEPETDTTSLSEGSNTDELVPAAFADPLSNSDIFMFDPVSIQEEKRKRGRHHTEV